MKIKISTFLYLVLLICFSAGYALGQGTHKPVKLGSSAAPYGYYEYLPTNFSKNSGKYPLLIFLHGAGEKGNGKDQLDRAVKFGPGREIGKGKHLPFVLLSPQTSDWWNADKLNDLINHAIKTYNIDPNRIYMTGLSMGAMGTFAYAAKYPDRLAAMVGIAGNADNSKVCNYSHVPLWAFHGDADPTVHVNGSKTLVAAYNKCSPTPNPQAKLTIMAGQKHWGWNEVYDGSRGDIYGWMLQYTKNGKQAEPAPAQKPNKAPVVNAGSDKSVTLPVAELTINGSAKDEDGSIKSYNWTKVSGPGVEMNGGNTNNLKLKKLAQGKYIFRLTAKDNAGASASDDMSLEVKPAATTQPKEEKPKNDNQNNEVAADAGADRTVTLPVKEEKLYGTAKFKNSAPGSYKWEKVSGPSVKMNGSGANLSLTQLNEGEYIFRFTATNTAGKSHSDDMKLKVLKENGKSTPTAEPAPASGPAPQGSVQGLTYSYYKIDPNKAWKKLPDLRKLKEVKKGQIGNFSLSPRDQNDYFAFAFDGYLKIDAAGDYFFYTQSDEGTKLYINDRLVVDNDGLHSSKVKYNRVKLGAGSHKIRVEYFENKGQEMLYVSYKGPGVSLQAIPANRLSTESTTVAKAGQNQQQKVTSSGLNYAYYESKDAHNRWNKLPDFSKLTPKKTGTVADFSLSPAQRTNHFGLVLEGQIRIDHAGDYTFFTDSDDGSQLFINGKRVVDNDGLHAPRERSGKVKLPSGYHAIRVVYHDYEGWEKLEVKWQGPGIGKQIIPASVLSRSADKQQNALTRNTGLQSDFVDAPEVAGLRLYPNPAQDQVHLQLGDMQEDAVTVSILDMSGRTLYQNNYQTGGGASVSLDLQSIGIARGAYLMTVRDKQSNKIKAFRFIRQ